MDITRRVFVRGLSILVASAAVPVVAIAQSKKVEKIKLFSIIDSIIEEGDQVTDILVEIRKDGHAVRYRDNRNMKVSRYQMASSEVVTTLLEAELGLSKGKLTNSKYMINMSMNGLRLATAPSQPNGLDIVIRVMPEFNGIYRPAKTYSPTVMI